MKLSKFIGWVYVLICIGFIAVKLLGIVTWPWWGVLLPIIIPTSGALVFALWLLYIYKTHKKNGN